MKHSKKAKKLFPVLLSTGLILSVAACVPTAVNAAKKPALNKKKLTLEVDGTATLKLKNISDKKQKKVKWSSDDIIVAAVSSNGRVTAKLEGHAKITAKLN